MDETAALRRGGHRYKRTVFDEAGELVAHGTSTLMALPGKGLKLGIAKFLSD